MPPRIGIFGGSFNPIHVGHLLVAEEAAERLRLDRVIFVPAGQSPFKEGRGMAPGAARLEMVRRSVAGNRRFQVSDVELRRGGKSFMVDTVEHFRRALPRGARLWLVLGQDAAAGFPAWREPRRILRFAKIAVATRAGGAPLGGLRRLTRPAEIPLRVDVSATEIRKRLSRGGSARYLVPDAALRVIARRRLYR